MTARSSMWFSIFVLLVSFGSPSLTQTKTSQDSAILSLIKNEGAFQHSQTNWQDLLPTFDLDSFEAMEQCELKRHAGWLTSMIRRGVHQCQVSAIIDNGILSHNSREGRQLIIAYSQGTLDLKF